MTCLLSRFDLTHGLHSNEISAVMQTHQHWEGAVNVNAILREQYLEYFVAVRQNPVSVLTMMNF